MNPARWSTLSLSVVILLTGSLGFLAGRMLPRPSAPADFRFPSTVTGPKNSPADTADTPVAPLAAAAASDTAAAPWQQRWTRLSATASTPSRDRELAALLEELAKTDPQKALALAAAETNWRLRDELRDAALRGWATVDPKAAGDTALRVRLEDRRAAVAAVLEGAAHNPDRAVKTALQLCRADPELAGDYGHSAIAALVNAGDFEAATRFGNEIGTDKYPFLLQSAYYQWARNQPDRALASAETIKDPILRNQAIHEAYSGWAKADAKKLAEHALQLPPGDARTQAFAEALPAWIEKDPVAATEWIQKNDSGSDFDHGAAALAHHQTLITRQPAKAMEWADSISNPQQRAETLRAVFRQWAEKDKSAARQYIDGLANPSDRALLDAELRDMSP